LATGKPQGRRDEAERSAHFQPRIESLRGIAALMVAVFHSIHLLPVDGIAQVYLRTIWDIRGPQALLTRLLMVFFNGGAAVSLFFVMSGFVLALSLGRDPRPVPQLGKAFLTRRFFRIYPPLALNVLLYAAAMWIVSSGWPRLYNDPPPTPRAIFDNLILIDKGVNGATWSLAVELLAVPFIFLAHLFTRGRSPWLILVPAILARIALYARWMLVRRPYLYLYLFMFLWGMAVAELGPLVSRWVSRRAAGVVLMVGFALLLGARFVFGYWSRASLGVEAIGAALVVAVVAYGPDLRALALLDGSAVRFLGRTSYSFYLYHPVFLSLGVPIVMWSLSSTSLAASYPLAVGFLIALTTVPPTLVAGKLSFDRIERPAVRWGRRVEGWLLEPVLQPPADTRRAATARGDHQLPDAGGPSSSSSAAITRSMSSRDV
jgi:peptidoglycan/LPS O-acetylase OafA/YrhL